MKIGFNETTIGIELSPFVLELARYRLLPSAYNQILQGNLYGAKAAQCWLRRRGRRVRGLAASLHRSGEPFGRFRPAELPPDESGDAVEYGFGASFGSRA